MALSDDEEFFDVEDEPEDSFHDAAESKPINCIKTKPKRPSIVTYADVNTLLVVWGFAYHESKWACLCVQVEQSDSPAHHTQHA